MSGEFRFETFVDVHSNIFNEYLSSVIAKLSKENEEYRAVQAEIEAYMRNIQRCSACLIRRNLRS